MKRKYLQRGWAVTGTILVTVAIAGGASAAAVTDKVLRERKAHNVAKQEAKKEAANNPFSGKKLYVEPNSNAALQAVQWRNSRPADAKQMDTLAALPAAKWITVEVDAGANLKRYLQGAKAANALPVTVAYNIPNRDCGMYSAGGADNAQQYRHFISTFANSINDATAVVILEPDALAQLQEGSCLSAAQKQERLTLLRYAVETFKKLPHTAVYVDAGNSTWVAEKDIAAYLTQAGIAKADGFALNVSNFRTSAETISYGKKIAGKLGGKHFVIDTSRNGLGPYENKARPEFSWCNPPGRALGHYPVTQTGEALVDAFLFIKSPGESDGADPDVQKCQGGPAAGKWWPEYALGLVQRWPKQLQPK